MIRYRLTEPDIPFVQDGVRDGQRIRHWMHSRFVEELAKTGVQTVRLQGPISKRMTTASQTIDHCIAACRVT